MKFTEVRLGDVKPNPFRKAEKYTLQPARIDRLRESIRKTGFWNNVIARENDGNVEIAYGHHRLAAAIAELGDDYVHAFPVSDIPDYKMLQIMGAENSEDWGNTTAHNNLTVSEVRDMLEEFCDAYPTWEEALGGELHGITGDMIQQWFGNAGAYGRAVIDGVGIRTIAAFLGWVDNKVRLAVAVLPPTSKQMAKLEAERKAAADHAEKIRKELEAARKAAKKAATAADKQRAAETEAHIEQQLDQAEGERHALEDELEERGHWSQKAGEVFEKPIHARTFRDIVTRDDFRKVVPVKSQVALAKKAVKHFGDDRMSVPALREWLWRQYNKLGIPNVDPRDPMERYNEGLNNLRYRITAMEKAHAYIREQMRNDGITEFPKMPESVIDSLVAAQNLIIDTCRMFGKEPLRLHRIQTNDGPISFRAEKSQYGLLRPTFERPVYEAEMHMRGLLDEESTLDDIGFWASNTGDSTSIPQQRVLEHKEAS